ncbi:MAG: NusG domain II-containing protein [Clostridia bacterium]|nr:NusG domain II-containing protein [Clostridia bacterium]
MLILSLAAAGAVMLLILWFGRRGKEAAQEMAVYVNGTLYATAALQPGKDVTVSQDNGCVNVIRMTEDGFYMESSTCKNQDCVLQGPVTRDNWTGRILGNQVICLPNRVIVELLVESSDPDLPDV